MCGVSHLSQKTIDVLFQHKVKEMVTALLVSRPIPYGRQQAGQHGHHQERKENAQELPPPNPQEYGGNQTRQDDAHWPFRQGSRTQAEYSHPGYASQVFLSPFIKLVQCDDHHCRQHHVHTAGHSGTVHLEIGQCEQSGHKGHLCTAPFGIEHIPDQHHGRQGQSRRHTRGVFIHRAGYRRNCSDTPMEERSLKANSTPLFTGSTQFPCCNMERATTASRARHAY